MNMNDLFFHKFERYQVKYWNKTDSKFKNIGKEWYTSKTLSDILWYNKCVI